jgi:hypothetical protein|nr:MAG TPA: hypothetical protein [Caudoviricetes sp.]
MKFKVGDKVKVIAKRHGHGFNIGEIVKIEEISDRDYTCSSLKENELWWMGEDEFTKVKFTKSDLKDGDIVTYRNGLKKIVSGDKLYGNDLFTSLRYYPEDLKDVDGEEKNDIVKVERPVKYETVFEREEVLDETEKKYLAEVIRPFRKRIQFIQKKKEITEINPYIRIVCEDNDKLVFPYITDNSMYKGMEVNKKYTLKELGL